jgi:uncharacterized Ntn-hydrolase superfamily protein
MTFSIVARCPRTGQYGVGVATYSPNVGRSCPVVVANRGAASMQAMVNPALNVMAAEMMAKGISAKKIIAELLECDPRPDSRQILMVDVYGQAHAVTGACNPAYAGHHVGAGYACGGNVLASEAVVKAMAASYEATVDLALSERLVRALEAARDAGGQPEGQTSAALLVYGQRPFSLVDLRVELDDEPVGELRRIWDWYQPMLPYFETYLPDSLSGKLKRWWEWRQENVPGWVAKHLR